MGRAGPPGLGVCAQPVDAAYARILVAVCDGGSSTVCAAVISPGNERLGGQARCDLLPHGP